MTGASLRPLRRVRAGNYLSRDGRYSFLCDFDRREWFAYDNREPRYDFQGEGTGRPVAEGMTGDVLNSSAVPINVGDPAESLAEALQMAEEWSARFVSQKGSTMSQKKSAAGT